MNIQKMKVSDLIANFVFPPEAAWYSDTSGKYHANWNDLCDVANRGYYNYDYEKFSQSVQEVYIATWICTDTRVGLSIITLHHKVVGVAWQNARKSEKHIDYVSIEAYHMLREFMMSCVPDDHHRISLLNMDDTIQFPTGNGVEIGHLKEYNWQ